MIDKSPEQLFTGTDFGLRALDIADIAEHEHRAISERRAVS